MKKPLWSGASVSRGRSFRLLLCLLIVPAILRADDPHAKVFSKSAYPSASECAPCHQLIYDEWRVSNHAYAAISPMFNKFEQRINELASGTPAFFCMRCHTGVGTAMSEPRELPIWKREQVSREGVTCISCHRVNEEYGKTNAERRIIPGDIFQPVYGSLDGTGVADIVQKKGQYNVATSPGDMGTNMHSAGIQFQHITTSEFCVSCHQVAVQPGIKLETVWDEYRASPAHAAGVSCQACHMGKEWGKASGYPTAPVAIVNGKEVDPGRKHSNHAFVGPGYPIAHPGLFPHNPDNAKYPIEAWLKFDYRAGWGDDAFEGRAAKTKDATFPEEWKAVDDRVQARLIVESNLALLAKKRKWRQELMESASRLDGPFFSGSPHAGSGLKFTYKVTNLNTGHNLPSGSLGAQPEIWLNVALIDPDGRRVWESGNIDSNGDFRDLHSLDVRAGKVEPDNQLFNLQSKFLLTSVKGTDREWYLPVPIDNDQIPFLRPSGFPTTNQNHPPFIRMEKRSLPPLATRDAQYSIPASALAKAGRYKLAVRMRSRAEPIYFMQFCRSTSEMERAMNEWMIDIHPYTVAFDVR